MMSSLTLLSRVLGLCRECMLGYYFGAEPILSSFRLAYQIPNLARRLFGEGALSAAFIPVFVECLHQHGRERARHLAGSVLTLLVITLVALTAALEAGVALAYVTRPGVTLALTAILLPYMVLICTTAFFGGILNGLRHFAAPAASPLVLNLAIIGSAWVGGSLASLPPDRLVYLIAVGIIGAGVAQLALQVWAGRRLQFRPIINRQWKDPYVRRIGGLMLPMALGLSVVQINTFMDSVIAFALVPDGRGLAILGYAQYLYQLPVGVVGVALATAVFPVLASLSATGDRSEFSRVVERGLRTTLFVSLPAVVGLVCIASPLVRGLYERGEFRADATARVARALTWYSLGVWCYCGQHILVRTFYALKESKTPAQVAAGMILLNLALNLVLVLRMGEAGVALATAISATVQFALLVRKLHPHLHEPRWRHVAGGAVRMAAASALMGAAIAALRTYGGLGTTWAARPILEVAVIVGGGVILYAAACYLLRVHEFSEAIRWLRDRRRSPE